MAKINDYEMKLWEMATQKKSFIPLLSSPKLLYYWQRLYPRDLMRIAKIASHRLKTHKLCGKDCETIDKFLGKYATVIE
jgi:hypothetical protein